MNEDKKVKFFEKLSHGFRKKWLVSGIQFLLIVAILFVAYFCIYYTIDYYEFPKIDVTENKVHTLSDASKNVLSKIDTEVEMYAFGFSDKDTTLDLLEQYPKANDKISFRTITTKDDIGLVNEFELEEGYYVVVIKCGDSHKIVDASEFETVDNTTYQYIDVTEQTITNSILSLVEENKPVVYFTEGHEEYADEELNTIGYLLTNESFTLQRINLFMQSEIPSDCDILAIIAPKNDFLESEVELIKKYVAKGGNLFISLAGLPIDKSFTNLQTILDEYGAEFENGIVYEKSELANTEYPFIYMPEISSTNQITKDIYSDAKKGFMTLIETPRIKIKDENTLNELKVESDILLNSSEDALFITNLSAETLDVAASTAEVGKSIIAATFEKEVKDENTDETKTSKLVLSSTSSFMADVVSNYVSKQYPLSYLGSNKDFVINSMSYLGDKDYFLTIRKDYAANTYTPTNTQNRIVLTIIFSLPLFIIFAGIIIWNYRKKKK